MKKMWFLLLFCLFMPVAAGADPADGIVDSVDDLALLQPGHWYRVKNSGLRKLGWYDDFPCNSPYHTGMERITDYSGATVSQRDRMLLVHGGGHAATAFNGILGFDLDTLEWTCVEEGSEKGIQDDWEPGKGVYLGNRILGKIDGVIHVFKVTRTFSSQWVGTTGKNEPDWSKARSPGASVNEDNDRITWTNMGIIGWRSGQEYVYGDRIIVDVGIFTPTTALWGDGQTSLDFFKCTSGKGRSGTIAPDWAASPNYGDTVTDGDLVWTNMGMIHYQNHHAKQESGGYPWEDKVGSVHSYSHLVFSENKNTFIKPVSFSWFPSGTGFINDHPWLYDMARDQWAEWVIDSDLNKLGAVNLSTMAIDRKRDIVWMYRKEGKAGPRLWSLDLNKRTWTARDDGKTYYGGGALAFINPHTDELILYGTYNNNDVYAVFCIDPDTFDRQGFVQQRYLYKKGIVGSAPTGDFDFVSGLDYQSQYAAYDTVQKILVAYGAEKDSPDDIKKSVYLLLPKHHHWIRVPAHPDNRMTPTVDVSRFYGRWNYIDAYNLFIYVDSIKHDVFLYKLSEDVLDESSPGIRAFSIPGASPSRLVPIQVFDVEDAHSWSVKYAVTESATGPPLSSPLWLDSPPAEYRITAKNGNVTLYAYAMDMFGNISSAATATTMLATDEDPPTVKSFVAPSHADSLLLDGLTLAGDDNVAVTGYLITESPDIPPLDHPGWRSSSPERWQLTGGGNFKLYAWLKDGEGNVSAPKSTTLSVELTEHVPGAIQVGPHREHRTLGEAINAANRTGAVGQRIEVDAGLPYMEQGEVYITVDDLTIVGVSGGLGKRAQLSPHDGRVSNNAFIANRHDGKGSGLTLQWLEISHLDEPAIKYHNSPAVGRLLIEDCKIHDSRDSGLLVGNCPQLEVVIRRTEFHSNGDGSGQYHNIYIGAVKELLLESSYSHDSNGGQLVKSRAAKNIIRYNRITDEGILFNSNQLIDLPCGGESYVIGNLLHMSTGNTSGSVIQWAREVWATVQVEDATKKMTQYPKYETYRIVRDGVPTGETFRGTYYSSLQGRTEHRTQATMPDLRVGDMLTWGDGAHSVRVTSVRFPWGDGPYARHLYVSGNTIVTDRQRSVCLVRVHKDSEKVVFVNNLIIDRGGSASWDHESVDERRITNKKNNLWLKTDPGLVDIDQFDYTLEERAHAVVDQGTIWGTSASGESLKPVQSYRHPLSVLDRGEVGSPDVGAYEFEAH